MGKRGPKPTPTRILQLRGSPVAKRRPAEPQLALCRLEPPAWLCDEAKPIFTELAQIIYDMGVSTRGDSLALGLLAESFALYIVASEELMRDGISTATESGTRKSNPALAARAVAWAEIARGLAWFGLSPSDRTRASKAGEETEDDKLAAILERFRTKPRTQRA